jgi:hypothetical protein
MSANISNKRIAQPFPKVMTLPDHALPARRHQRQRLPENGRLPLTAIIAI